jgi:formylglycine-generating enzyme required for sulfatase activity
MPAVRSTRVLNSVRREWLSWIVLFLLIPIASVNAHIHASALAQTKQGPIRTKVNSREGLEYVWIEPATFLMGCVEDDFECTNDDGPRHAVTLSRGYWIGQTLVTQAAYRKIVGKNPSKFTGESLPVENVSWDEATAFCVAAGMRLPTEAEWEYSARGGIVAARYAPIDAAAWYRGNSAGQTHPVAQKRANAYGLYDMLGNVWEWVSDWNGRYDRASVVDPKGPPTGRFRVLRGGSWNDFSSDVRASARDHLVDGEDGGSHPYLDYSVGFRCAGD